MWTISPRCQACPPPSRTWSCATWKPRQTGGPTQPTTTARESAAGPRWTKRCARRTWAAWHGCTWRRSRRGSTTIWRWVVCGWRGGRGWLKLSCVLHTWVKVQHCFIWNLLVRTVKCYLALPHHKVCLLGKSQAVQVVMTLFDVWFHLFSFYA